VKGHCHNPNNVDYDIMMENYSFDFNQTPQSKCITQFQRMSTNVEDLGNTTNFQKLSQNEPLPNEPSHSLTGSKRKRFNSIEEHQKFVEDYKKKYKTEICKNFEFRGYCQWGDQCSFAHGQQELRTKTHIN